MSQPGTNKIKWKISTIITNLYKKIPSFSSIHDFYEKKEDLAHIMKLLQIKCVKKYKLRTVSSENTLVSLIVVGTLPLNYTV